MLAKTFSIGLDLLALVTPISIAATNIVFFPLAVLWLAGERQTLARWPALWGKPEKYFLVFLASSVMSALAGHDPAHSLAVIKNKDFYIGIAIVLVALVRDEKKNAKLIRLFMTAALATAIFGILQFVIGVSQDDKSNGVFLYLPPALAHWPRPLLDLLSLLNGRVMGTRAHPLAYAECLLFNWSLAACFLLSSPKRQALRWLGYMALTGAALLWSQSRGPWIAGAVILLVAMVTPITRRAWWLLGLILLFAGITLYVPSLQSRAYSIVDREHQNNAERLHMWEAGLKIWKSHPIFGIGPGSVKAISGDFQTPEEHKWGNWGHLHSIYINFLAERGALGLGAYLLFIGSLLGELWQALKRAADAYEASVYKGALLGIASFLIGGFTETSYNTAVVSMTFYFVTGLALALARHGKDAAHT